MPTTVEEAVDTLVQMTRDSAVAPTDQPHVLEMLCDRLRDMASESPADRLVAELVHVVVVSVVDSPPEEGRRKFLSDLADRIDAAARNLVVARWHETAEMSGTVHRVLMGDETDLSKIPAERIRPYVRHVISEIHGMDGQDDRIAAAVALLRSLNAAPRDTPAGSDEVMSGAMQSLVAGGFRDAIHDNADLKARALEIVDNVGDIVSKG